jgi:hypothetical protein
MQREGRYETKSDQDSLEDLSKKLTNDLRKNIRELSSQAVLSDAWLAMADSLGRIASITEMEQKLPKENDNATLWECEELALRYILEDGKLNLCLRNLVEYKQYMAPILKSGESLEGDKQKKADKFELSLGTLLKNAWLHVEALQTTDLPLLIDYIALVLKDATDDSPSNRWPEKLSSFDTIGTRQEAMVLHYLHGLCKRIDDIEESRVMPLIEQSQVIPLTALFLHQYHPQLAKEDLRKGAEALAVLFDTEEYGMHPDRFVEDVEAKRALAALKEDFLEQFSEDMDQRRAIRPLLDESEKARRELPSK